MENRSDIDKNFVTYELAVKLKELGFNEECLGFSYMRFNCEGVSNATFKKVVPNYLYNPYDLICKAPLWSQAFDYFRINHNLHVNIICGITNYTYDIIRVTDFASELGKDFVEYEEARQACLEKLIELVTMKVK